MNKTKSKRLVIDASVAHASGGESATHPDASHTRDFLLTVLKVCHKVVMSPAIQAEWDKHQSRFARTWRASMVARKKLLLSDMDERRDIRQEIEQAPVAESLKKAMHKDCHLLESAIATDNRIVSLDDKVRHLFKSELDVQDVNSVMWVNPIVDPEQLLVWLEEGSPDRQEYKLS